MSEQTRGGSIDRNKKPPTQKILRKNHLLVIGIDKYSHGIPQLNNAVRDAKDFQKILLEHYQFEQSVPLFDKDATKDNILEAFDHMLATLTDNDNLVLYFSGHGELHDLTKRGYWIPVDATLGKRGDYLSNNDVVDFFKNCKAHHIFAIVDSCFSGALFQTRKLTNVAERLDNVPSRWLLTAGLKEPVSDGSFGSNSPFAKALIAHLKGNEQPALWVSDLCNRVLQGVVFNEDKQTPRGEPLPDVGHLGGQFVFYKKGYVPTATESVTLPNSTPERAIETPTDKEPVIPQKPASFATLDDLIVHFKLLIAEDLDEFFKEFNEKVDSKSRLFDNSILQRGSYNSTKRKQNEGVIRDDDAERSFARVRKAMTEYIDSMKAEDLKPEHRPG
jgi:hypothetical protein